jgi:hypothetical protein
MTYWVVFKIQNGRHLYVTGTDECGYPKHSVILSEAWKFRDFNIAMNYFNLGYIIEKY